MRLLFFVFSWCLSYTTFGQIEEVDSVQYKIIGKIIDEKRVLHKLETAINNGDTLCRLTVGTKNLNLKSVDWEFSYKTIIFRETGGVLNTLYNASKLVFNKENRNDENYIRVFTLGSYKVEIKTYLLGKKVYAWWSIFYTDGSFESAFLSLSEKELDKLFGR